VRNVTNNRHTTGRIHEKIHKELLIRLGFNQMENGRNRRFPLFILNWTKKKSVEKRRITATATLAAAASWKRTAIITPLQLPSKLISS
jgi:hypothetical protein